MDNSYTKFFYDENIQIDVVNFILNLIVAIILSFLVQLTYNKTSNSLSNATNFSKNFVILGLTTTIVITIVKSSLALSLGLVGALSIVRFRAAIKEPEELVFLFLIIAVGLGCGAGQINITVIGTLVSIIIIFTLKYLRKNKKEMLKDRFNASLISNEKLDKYNLKEVIELFSSYSSQSEFISLSQDSNSTTINLLSKFKNLDNINELNKILKKKFPNLNFVFVKDSSNAI